MINPIIIFAATLEKDIEKAVKTEKKAKGAEFATLKKQIAQLPVYEDKKVIEAEFAALKKEIEPYQKTAPKPTFREKIKGAFSNIKNIARNAYDNTAGLVAAKYQNYQTKKYYRKEPGSDKPIVYLIHGLFQNEGSQRKLGKQLIKEGLRPYHLKGYHHLPREENAERAWKQIDNLHDYAKLKEAYKRKDVISGHSSGADLAIYMAGDKRVTEYGVKQVQARAPASSGIKPRTLAQKLLMPFAPQDNIKKSIKAKEGAIDIAKRKPYVAVTVFAGKYDNLVPPSDAAYKYAEKHIIIDDPNSTHFGTSGVNPEMNKIFIDSIKGEEYSKKYKRKAA